MAEPEPRQYAIAFYLDTECSARFAALQEALAAAGLPPLPADQFPPHVTLALLQDLDPGRLAGELRAFAATQAPLALLLSAVGTFPGPEGVVYIAPVVTAELLDLHRRLHARLAGLAGVVNPLYAPGAWVPHCTVAYSLPEDRVPAAVGVCRASDAFGPVRLETLALVEFPPPREIQVCPLGARPPASG
jgi:2'-5' RNA ligase